MGGRGSSSGFATVGDFSNISKLSSNRVSMGKSVSLVTKKENVEIVTQSGKTNMGKLLQNVNDFTVELYNDNVGKLDFNRIEKLGFKAKKQADSGVTRMIYFKR